MIIIIGSGVFQKCDSLAHLCTGRLDCRPRCSCVQHLLAWQTSRAPSLSPRSLFLSLLQGWERRSGSCLEPLPFFHSFAKGVLYCTNTLAAFTTLLIQRHGNTENESTSQNGHILIPKRMTLINWAFFSESKTCQEIISSPNVSVIFSESETFSATYVV